MARQLHRRRARDAGPLEVAHRAAAQVVHEPARQPGESASPHPGVAVVAELRPEPPEDPRYELAMLMLPRLRARELVAQ
jgi:hypothetical protein